MLASVISVATVSVGFVGSLSSLVAVPRAATAALVTGLTALLAMALPPESLAEATSIITLPVFALANVALAAVKLRDPGGSPTLKGPAFVPVIGATVSLGLLAIRPAQTLGGG